MFANPAEARLGCQRPLEDGGGVDEGAPLTQGLFSALKQLGAARFDAITQLFEPVAQHFVVVATESIAADIAEGRIAQGGGEARLERQVVHPHRQHPHRARQQLVGARAHHAVARHVIHAAVIARIQPGLQSRLFDTQVGVGDARLVKS